MSVGVDLTVQFTEFRLFLRERANDPDGGDSLGEQGVNRRDLSSDGQRKTADLDREDPVVHRVDRQDEQGHERQPPLEPEHHPGDPDGEDQVVDELKRPAVEEDQDRADVAGDSGHQPPGLLGVEVGHRQPHQLALEGPPERDDQLLTGAADRPRDRPRQGHSPQVTGHRADEDGHDQPERDGLIGGGRVLGPPHEPDEMVEHDPLQDRNRQHQERLDE